MKRLNIWRIIPNNCLSKTTAQFMLLYTVTFQPSIRTWKNWQLSLKRCICGASYNYSYMYICTRPPHLPPVKPYAGEETELDMEQWTGLKSGKEYAKAACCHSAYSTYMQSTSCDMLSWMKLKLESRLLGEISITSDMQMTPT